MRIKLNRTEVETLYCIVDAVFHSPKTSVQVLAAKNLSGKWTQLGRMVLDLTWKKPRFIRLSEVESHALIAFYEGKKVESTEYTQAFLQKLNTAILMCWPVFGIR